MLTSCKHSILCSMYLVLLHSHHHLLLHLCFYILITICLLHLCFLNSHHHLSFAFMFFEFSSPFTFGVYVIALSTNTFVFLHFHQPLFFVIVFLHFHQYIPFASVFLHFHQDSLLRLYFYIPITICFAFVFLHYHHLLLLNVHFYIFITICFCICIFTFS